MQAKVFKNSAGDIRITLQTENAQEEALMRELSRQQCTGHAAHEQCLRCISWTGSLEQVNLGAYTQN